MGTDQHKKNVYAILFFLAILFVAIGFERHGGVSGFYARQSASFPERWYVSCAVPTPEVSGRDLGTALYNTFGYQRGKTATYCQQAADGINLPKKITVQVSCASLTDKQTFVRACQDQLETLYTSSSPSSPTSRQR